jgi:hypothetical protein
VLNLEEKGIAWPQDKGVRFKNLPGTKKADQWIDVESGKPGK